MKQLCFLLVWICVLSAKGTAQNDSGMGNKGDALMDLDILLHAYDSSRVLFGYSIKDSSTLENIEVGNVFKLISPGVCLNLFVFSIGSSESYSQRITLQNSQYRVQVATEDSTILIYDPDTDLNITDVPVLNPLYNNIYMKDIFTTIVDDTLKKLTVLFNPGARYKRMDLVFNPGTYILKTITYYSDDVRYISNEENALGIQYTRMHIATVISTQLGFPLEFLSMDTFFRKSGDEFIPGPDYTGFTIVPVF